MFLIPTIPYDRKVNVQLAIARTDGSTWEDISEYLQSAEVNLGDVSSLGTGDSGGDSVVRRMNFTIQNDRSYIPVWNNNIAQDETYIVGQDTTIIGNENDAGEKLINLLFDTDNRLKGTSFQPRDKESLRNQFNGNYNPLIFPTREVVLRIALFEDPNGINGIYNQELGTTQIIQENLGVGDGTTKIFNCQKFPVFPSYVEFYVDGIRSDNFLIDYDSGEITTTANGTCTINYIYYHTLFAGYMGDNISSDGYGITCNCRDYAKRLQDKYIDTSKEYGSEAGTPAENVIQQILTDNGLTNIDFYCPVSPGFMIKPYTVEYVSVFDATQDIANQIGWFLGFKWDPNINKFRYTLMEPPRDKNSSNADYTLTARDDIYAMSLDTNDKNIRNIIKVNYIDANGDKQSVTVDDQDSIDEFWEKPMEVGFDNTSLIDTEQEALDFGNYALADLKDLTGQSRITMPIFPHAELFIGINLDNPLLSSTVDFFALESVRHIIQIKENRSILRTDGIANGKVIGGRTKWLAMQTRPGAGKPIDEDQIPGKNINAPTNLSIVNTGIEEQEDISMAYAEVSWDAPTGYKPQYYIIQMQVAGGNWSNYQEFFSRTTQQKILFNQGVNYEIRIQGFSKVNNPGTYSSVLQISEVNNNNAPVNPVFDTINSYFRKNIYLKWLADNKKMPYIFEIREDLNWGDGSHLYQGKNTNYLIDDLNDLSNPSSPTQTLYIKSVSYNGVYSNNYDSITVSNTIPSDPTGLTIDSSTSQLHLLVNDPGIDDLDYIEYQIHDSSDYSGNYSTYKKQEYQVSLPIITDGINYCRVRFVDVLGQTSNWVTASTNAQLITRDDMQGAIFNINPSSDITPASGSLEQLWDRNTTTGPSFNSAPTITFEYPMTWFFDMVRFYPSTNCNYYVQIYNENSQSWVDIAGSSSSMLSAAEDQWNIQQFDAKVATRKLRIVFDSVLTLYELKFWTVTMADEILAQVLTLTGNMMIQNSNGSVYIDANKLNVINGAINLLTNTQNDGLILDANGLKGKVSGSTKFSLTNSGEILDSDGYKILDPNGRQQHRVLAQGIVQNSIGNDIITIGDIFKPADRYLYVELIPFSKIGGSSGAFPDYALQNYDFYAKINANEFSETAFVADDTEQTYHNVEIDVYNTYTIVNTVNQNTFSNIINAYVWKLIEINSLEIYSATISTQ